MPRRPNIPCKHPGCAALIPHGQMYCEEHKPLHTKDRAHAAERGYGAKWQRERRKFLESNPFCVKCYEEGHITMANRRGSYRSASWRPETLLGSWELAAFM